MLNYNPITDCDSYKLSHWKFYPEGTQRVYSYMESRGGLYPETVMFGLQGLIKQYLLTPFSGYDIEEAADMSASHFGTSSVFNREGFDHILNKHGGYWPVEIKAVPEGMVIPNRNVLMTVENTDDRVPFVTSFIETMALRLWYPITVASRARKMKQVISYYFETTSDHPDGVDFACHNFGDRGATSYDSAMIAGSAHLVSFKGTDSVPALRYLRHHYGTNMAGHSVPATEHSIMCSYGQSHELYSLNRIIDECEPGTIISVVSDTWNIFNACHMWVSLADKIKAKNLTLVVRPDSGDAEDVLPRVLEILKNGFGFTTNSKGYDVLDSVKVLWGDGMNENTCYIPFSIAMEIGIASDSVLVGAGGGTVQNDLNRDTNKFAFKASNITINDVDIPIAKDPITDKGKRSKKGRMILKHTPYWDNKYFTYTTDGHPTKFDMYKDEDVLRPVYRNGELLIEDSFDTIRERFTL